MSTIFTSLLNSARTRGSFTLLSCYTRLAKRALCYVIASHPIEHASTGNPRFDIHPCCDKHARRRRNRHYLTYGCAVSFTLSIRFSLMNSLKRNLMSGLIVYSKILRGIINIFHNIILYST